MLACWLSVVYRVARRPINAGKPVMQLIVCLYIIVYLYFSVLHIYIYTYIIFLTLLV